MSVSDLEKSIFVGNIHSCVTEEILFELFLQAGPVEKVHIFRNGHQMPYGVVYYKHAEAVPYAVELLDGIWIYGQPIKLQCKYGRHYQENDIWCTTGMTNGVIANSEGAVYRDDMVSNVNKRPGVENHGKTPHDWSDMATQTFLNDFNRSTDPMICAFQLCHRLCVVQSTPPAVEGVGIPPWTSYRDEQSLFFMSSNTNAGCANVSLMSNKHKHRKL